jgi:hypothetical protein
MSKITKFFRGKVRSIDPVKFTAEVVITDETVDRYKEIVRVDAMKKAKGAFMEHPILLSSHNYRGLTNQIGHFEKLKVDQEKKEVLAYPKYYVGEGNPEADWGWKLVEKGIAAFSIGFISKKFKEFTDEERKENGNAYGAYEEIELLEVSQVLIPANPSALQKSFDSATEQGEKDFIQEIIALCKEYGESETVDGGIFVPPELVDEVKKVLDGEEGTAPATDKDTLLHMQQQISSMMSMLVDVRASVLRAVEKMEELSPTPMATVTSEVVVNAMDAETFKKYVSEHKEEILSILAGKAPPVLQEGEPLPVEDNDIHEILDEEKLREFEDSLRKSMSVSNDNDFASVREVLDQMTEEMTRIFSVQPSGQ